MKKLTTFLMATFFTIAVTTAQAQPSSQTVVMSALIPLSTAVVFSANAVDTATGKVFSSVGTNLSFGTLKLTTNKDGSQRFESDKYFAIDIAGTGGAGTPNVDITYQEGTESGVTRLGDRAAVVFKAMKFNSASPGQPYELNMSAHPKRSLTSMRNITVRVKESEILNVGASWLRLYIGLNTGEDKAYVPFNPSDSPNTYTGRLIISATL